MLGLVLLRESLDNSWMKTCRMHMERQVGARPAVRPAAVWEQYVRQRSSVRGECAPVIRNVSV